MPWPCAEPWGVSNSDIGHCCQISFLVSYQISSTSFDIILFALISCRNAEVLKPVVNKLFYLPKNNKGENISKFKRFIPRRNDEKGIFVFYTFDFFPNFLSFVQLLNPLTYFFFEQMLKKHFLFKRVNGMWHCDVFLKFRLLDK